MKKGMIILLVCAMLLTSSCTKQQEVITNSSAPVSSTIDESSRPLTEEEKDAQENFSKSTPENDTDIGLKTVKIDTADANLTQEQKNIVHYFDNDYFTINDFEFLRRYPMVFEDAQVEDVGIVEKVVSQNGNDYELLLWCGDEWDDPEHVNLMLIRGTVNGTLYLEGDRIVVHGSYSGLETMDVDGKSITVPTLYVYDAYMPYINDIYQPRFSNTYIKNIAKTIFGDDIVIRKLNSDETDDYYMMDFYLAVELENQNNIKLSKFYFETATGKIWDSNLFTQSSLERHIEFSADLRHFYVISYDYALYSYSIECYDQQLNKIWKREFEEVQPPESEGLMDRIYDYTKNNFYLTINNELYIIDAQTGENTFPPVYVGDKVSVNKLADGIVLISNNKADGIMKVDLNGNVVWRTNVPNDIMHVFGIQNNNDNIVVYAETINNDTYVADYHYFVLDCDTGSMILDAISMQ